MDIKNSSMIWIRLSSDMTWLMTYYECFLSSIVSLIIESNILSNRKQLYYYQIWMCFNSSQWQQFCPYIRSSKVKEERMVWTSFVMSQSFRTFRFFIYFVLKLKCCQVLNVGSAAKRYFIWCSVRARPDDL